MILGLRIQFLYWVIGVLGIVLISDSVSAQDTQFSQFYANPLSLNPALTGSHSGSYRIMLGYRSQWNNPLEEPLNLSAISGDLKFNISKNGRYSSTGDWISVGVNLVNDRNRVADYYTTGLGIMGAFHKLLSAETNQYLSIGVQLGMLQRGINFTALDFPDEFNGVNAFDRTTEEDLLANSVFTSDMAIGLHYSIQPLPKVSYQIGGAIYHWNRPEVSFTGNEELPAKYIAHAGATFEIESVYSLQPRIIYLSQGDAQSIVGGANWRYNFPNYDEMALIFGAWWRSTNSLTTWQPTDVIPSIGFVKDGWQLGISMDFGLRQLSGQVLGDRTLEISISYTGQHENYGAICPSF